MYYKVNLFILAVFISTLSTAQDKSSPTFRLTKWGDSKKEVMQLEETRMYVDHPDLLVYKDSAYGVEMLIKYQFMEDSLYAAYYVVIEDYDFEDYTGADYEEVRKEAIAIIGEEPHDESRPIDYEDFQKWLEEGIEIFAEWNLPRSEVRLQMLEDEYGFSYIEVLVTAKKN